MKQVLILVDLQNDFISGSLGSVEAQAIIPNIVELIKSWSGDICVTRDKHSENYLYTFEGKHLPVEHCIVGTEGFILDTRISEALKKTNKHIKYFDKNTFGSIELIHSFDYQTEFTVAGLCTDICVISNVLLLKAKYYFNSIKVIANCCAGSTPEKHKAALEVMKSCHIEIV